MAALAGASVCASHVMVTPVAYNSSWTVSFSNQTTASRFSGIKPWNCFAVANANRNSRPWRPMLAAQKAAQTEATEEEEELEDLEEASTTQNGVPHSSLVEGLKAALAADDETSIAKLEAQQRAMEEEKDALAKQVASLLEESQTARERLLRLNADFDNFRKRAATEKANLFSSAKGDVIEALLPMVDNFERAKSSILTETEGEQKIDKSYQGIYKQFVEIMKGFGVVAVETVGKQFDPNLHEAIMREESSEYDEGVILQEFRRGFSIGDKLVRPAMVKVSAGPGPAKDVPEPQDVIAGPATAEEPKDNSE